MRLERPVQIDLSAIAQGVIKNNMGVGGIELRVRGALAEGRATLTGTGQVLPVSGGPVHSSLPWLRLDGKDLGLGTADAVQWIAESAGPR
ncbi:MAG TPA: hypothetical protein VFZ65_17520 [Planctomycetota bacterium]|nr:hypothetical protein [Planctomycetota bacterium]